MGLCVKHLVIIPVALGVAACTTVRPLPPALPEEPQVIIPYAAGEEPGPVVAPKVVAPVPPVPDVPLSLVPTMEPAPDELRVFPHGPAKKGKTAAAKPVERPEDLVENVNKQGIVSPTRAGFGYGTSTAQRYPLWEGRLYEVYTSPNHPTTIRLPKGERLAPKFVPTLNPEAWQVGVVEQGEGEETFHAVIVRPVAEGQEATTPLLMRSGKAIYLRLRSFPRTSMVEVTWENPLQSANVGQLAQLSQVLPGQLPYETNSRRASVIPPGPPNTARAHTAYEIKPRGSVPPPWLPAQAWDDGSTTYILFKESLRHTNAPGVFGHTNTGGKPHLVQFTAWEQDGRQAYIVRGLWPRIELKGDGMAVDIIRR
jgi:type IV secretory pathway VirB9-like protein